MARFYLDSTVSAAEDWRDSLARISKRFGDSATAARYEGRPIKISVRESRAIATRARLDAAAWVEELNRKARLSLRASVEAGDSSHIRGIKASAVIRESVGFDDEATAPIEFGGLTYGDAPLYPESRAKRAAKPAVRSGRADQRERGKRLPYQKYLKEKLIPDVIQAAEARAKDPDQTAEARAAARKLAANLKRSQDGQQYVSARLKENQQSARLQTMRTTLRSIRNRDDAEADDAILGYQYNLGMAKEHTYICKAYSGWTMRKDDPLLRTRRPANHWGCVSWLLPLTRVMMKAMGLKFHTPPKVRYIIPMPGFGG